MADASETTSREPIPPPAPPPPPPLPRAPASGAHRKAAVRQQRLQQQASTDFDGSASGQHLLSLVKGPASLSADINAGQRQPVTGSFAKELEESSGDEDDGGEEFLDGIRGGKKSGSPITLDIKRRGLSRASQLRSGLSSALRRAICERLAPHSQHDEYCYLNVDASDNSLGVAGMNVILEFLRRLRRPKWGCPPVYVKELRLHKNKLQDEGARVLAQLILSQPKPLYELHLSHNEISGRGASTLVLAFGRAQLAQAYPFRLWNRPNQFGACWLRMEWNDVANPDALTSALKVHDGVRIEETSWHSRDWGPGRSPSWATKADVTPHVILHIFDVQEKTPKGNGKGSWNARHNAAETKAAENIIKEASEAIGRLVARLGSTKESAAPHVATVADTPPSAVEATPLTDSAASAKEKASKETTKGKKEKKEWKVKEATPLLTEAEAIKEDREESKDRPDHSRESKETCHDAGAELGAGPVGFAGGGDFGAGAPGPAPDQAMIQQGDGDAGGGGVVSAVSTVAPVVDSASAATQPAVEAVLGAEADGGAGAGGNATAGAKGPRGGNASTDGKNAVAKGASTAAGLDDLEDFLRKQLDQLVRTAAEQTQVDECLLQLQSHIQERVGGDDGTWRVDAFGSVVTGIGTRGCDLDVVAYEQKEGHVVDAQSVVRKLGKLLVGTLFIVKEMILHARIPILKLQYKDQEVDLSVNNTAPLMNTRLLKAYTTMVPRVAELCILIKTWMKERKLCGAPNGHLSSYGFTLMVIYFLQVFYCFPSLQKGGDEDDAFKDDAKAEAKANAERTNIGDVLLGYSLQELFTNFFAFYARFFDWNSEVVSIRIGHRTNSDSQEFSALKGRQDKRLHIEDPFDRTRNLRDVLWVNNEAHLYHMIAHMDVLACMRLQPVPPIQVARPQATNKGKGRRKNRTQSGSDMPFVHQQFSCEQFWSGEYLLQESLAWQFGATSRGSPQLRPFRGGAPSSPPLGPSGILWPGWPSDVQGDLIHKIDLAKHVEGAGGIPEAAGLTEHMAWGAAMQPDFELPPADLRDANAHVRKKGSNKIRAPAPAEAGAGASAVSRGKGGGGTHSTAAHARD